MSAEVTIYTTRVCGYCVAAKRLLTSRKVAYTEVDVSNDNAKREWLGEATGRPPVPQIFIGGEALGGYAELAALDRPREVALQLREEGEGLPARPPRSGSPSARRGVG